MSRVRLGPDAAILFPGVVTIRPAPPKITLDRVRPTVVRRRVFETSPPPAATAAGFADEYDDDENGPPSSVNVARALASLRGHELRRLDEILTRDDEVAPPAPAAPAPPPVPAVPTVGVGASISLIELARRMSITQEELVTALVTRGFFDVTVKATLPRETARAAGAMFGWKVEDTDEVASTAKKAKPKAAKTKAAKPKPAKPKPAKPKPRVARSKAAPGAKARAKPAPKAKPKPKARPATRARRTSR